MIENEKKRRRQKKLQQLGGQKYSTYCLKEYNRKKKHYQRAATALYRLIRQLRSDSSKLPASKPEHAHTGKQGRVDAQEEAGGETRERGPGSRELKGEESESEETDTRHWMDVTTENQQVLKPYVEKRMEYPEPAEYKCPECTQQHPHKDCIFRGGIFLNLHITPSRETANQHTAEDASLVVMWDQDVNFRVANAKAIISPLVFCNYLIQDFKQPLQTFPLIHSYHALSLLSHWAASPSNQNRRFAPIPPPLIKQIWSFAYGKNASPSRGFILQIPGIVSVPEDAKGYYYEGEYPPKEHGKEMVEHSSFLSVLQRNAGKRAEDIADEIREKVPKPSAGMVWCPGWNTPELIEKEKRKKAWRGERDQQTEEDESATQQSKDTEAADEKPSEEASKEAKGERTEERQGEVTTKATQDDAEDWSTGDTLHLPYSRFSDQHGNLLVTLPYEAAGFYDYEWCYDKHNMLLTAFKQPAWMRHKIDKPIRRVNRGRPELTIRRILDCPDFSFSIELNLEPDPTYPRTPTVNIADLSDHQREYLAKKNTKTSLLDYYPQSYERQVHKPFGYLLSSPHRIPETDDYYTKLSANYSSVMLTFAIHSRNLVASDDNQASYSKSNNLNTKKQSNEKITRKTRTRRSRYVSDHFAIEFPPGFNYSCFYCSFRKWYEEEVKICQTEYPLECVSQCNCDAYCPYSYYDEYCSDIDS